MTCSQFTSLTLQGCSKGHRPTYKLLSLQQNPVRGYSLPSSGPGYLS